MTTTTTAQTIPPTTETAQATFISIVADASGSMNHLHETVIKGLNDFIAEQASTDNDAKVTIVQFPSVKDEDGIQTILPKSNVKTARKITGDDYVINGMTPLYDAIGAVIKKADLRIAKRVAKGKDPESQVVVIFTDGGENASRKFTKEDIFALIAERKAQGWVFVFLGANQDAFEEGGQVGFAPGNTMNFDASEDGMTNALMSVSRSVRAYSAMPMSERFMVSDAIFSIDDEDDEDDL
jgi:Mg-chelatase subunit ChlD